MNFIPLVTAFVAICLFILKETREFYKEKKQNKEIITFMELEISKNMKIVSNIVNIIPDFDEKNEKIKEIDSMDDNGTRYLQAITEFLNEVVSDEIIKAISYSNYSLSVSAYKEVYLKKPFDLEAKISHYIILEEMSKLINLIRSLKEDSIDTLKKYYLLSAIYRTAKKISDTYDDMTLKNKLRIDYENNQLDTIYKLESRN